MPDKKQVLAGIHEACMMPIIRVPTVAVAVHVAEAILEGGVNVVEITMSVPGALDAIGELHERHGDDVLLGAGSVIEEQMARDAVETGAQFIVGPAVEHGMIRACREMNVSCFPGALTPSEVLEAWTAGADVVKIFPAGNIGGASYIRALKAPLPQIELMPTGGVNIDTAADFIKAGSFCLGVGSAIVNKKAVADGDYGLITEYTRRLVGVIREARSA